MSGQSIRETGSNAYSNGSGSIHSTVQRLTHGSQLSKDLQLNCDVCVVGTGAGGAVAAKELAEAGLTVVVLEEGSWIEQDSLKAQPREAMLDLFRDANQTVTLGRPVIPIPTGKAVGGTTLINTGTCFRTPRSVLEDWQQRLGLEHLHAEELDPYFRRVERILNVSQVPPELAGANAEIIREAAEKLGYSGDYIYRNVRGCIGSGICNFGCPSGAKQHTGITYIPLAWQAGAELYSETRVEQIEHHAGTVTAVRAVTTAGAQIRVGCKRLFVACGTLNTPLLLKRSGIDSRSKQLGRNLSIHPAGVVRALLDRELEYVDAVPQSYYIDHFADQGIMFEGSPATYELASLVLGTVGEQHRETMLKINRYARFALMISDSSRGTVSSAFGRPLVSYRFNRADIEKVRLACQRLAELYVAAGAQEIVLPIRGVPPLKPDQIGEIASYRLKANDLRLMGFHPLGTARIGWSYSDSVVDQDLKMHGFKNLYIADGSVVPTSLGVNPMITVMALVTRCVFAVTEQAAPNQEPYPEHIADPKVKLTSL